MLKKLLICRGGLELLFGNEKSVEIDVPAKNGKVSALAFANAYRLCSAELPVCFSRSPFLLI